MCWLSIFKLNVEWFVDNVYFIGGTHVLHHFRRSKQTANNIVIILPSHSYAEGA